MIRFSQVIYEKLKNLPAWVSGILLFVITLLIILSFPKNTTPPSSNDILGSGAVASTGLALNIFVKLSLVTFAMYLGLILLRKWKKGSANHPHSKMTIIESIHLNPHQSLHLIRVFDKFLLIGCTNQNISCISAIENLEKHPAEKISIQDSPIETNDNVQTFPQLIAQMILKH
jgi:flagellar biogenesis protein FliO